MTFLKQAIFLFITLLFCISIYTIINCIADLYWLGKERCKSLFGDGKAKNVLKLLQIAVIGFAFTGFTAAFTCCLHMSSLHH